MSGGAICKHCGVFEEEHDRDVLASQCYPAQIERLESINADMLAALKQCTSRADEDLKKYFHSRTSQCAKDYAMCMAAIAKAEGTA